MPLAEVRGYADEAEALVAVGASAFKRVRAAAAADCAAYEEDEYEEDNAEYISYCDPVRNKNDKSDKCMFKGRMRDDVQTTPKIKWMLDKNEEFAKHARRLDELRSIILIVKAGWSAARDAQCVASGS